MVKVKIDKDVEYSAQYGLKLDVYQDEEQTNLDGRRAIIDIHGGGWWLGYKEEETDWATKFVNAGYIVFVPNYRLAPDNLYPAAADDVVSVYDWIKTSPYQFDRNKIGAVGMSSGGNLAVELGIRRGIPIASWSGIVDLDAWIESHPDVIASNKTAPTPGTPVGQINQVGANDPYYKWFVLNYVGSDMALLKEASPIHRISKTTGPMFLANSLDEITPTDGVERLQHALTENAVQSTVKFVSGHGHGEAYMDRAQEPTLAFFDEFLA